MTQVVSLRFVSSYDSTLVLPKQGQWQAIAQRTLNFQKSVAEGLTDEVAWHVLAQMKLRNFAAASEALSSTGNLESQNVSADGASSLQAYWWTLHCELTQSFLRGLKHYLYSPS